MEPVFIVVIILLALLAATVSDGGGTPRASVSASDIAEEIRANTVWHDPRDY